MLARFVNIFTFFHELFFILFLVQKWRGFFVDPSDPTKEIDVQPSVPAVEKIGIANMTDIISIGTLLNASGVDIDAMSLYFSFSFRLLLLFLTLVFNGSTGVVEGESIRYSGAIFMVIIEYQNALDHLFRDDSHYTIRVKLLDDTEYKAIQAVYSGKLDNRTIYNRHAISFVFLQTGKLVQFDVQALLLQGASGLTLLSFATFVTDFLARWCCWRKEIVHNLKIKRTADLMKMDEEEQNEFENKQRLSEKMEFNIEKEPVFYDVKSGSLVTLSGIMLKKYN